MARSWSLLALCLTLACHPAPQPRDQIELLVIAPHPDDEVLIAGGRIAQTTARGGKVAVILVTNGDYGCERDGYLREAESISALSLLGVKPADVHFLGYPDGALKRLSATPLDAMEHRDATGECTARTGTWADRAAGRVDEHTRRTGAPADWTADNLVGDLAALLSKLDPREIALPHGLDDHPDHAMTYVFFRRALDTLTRAPALVHRGVVHAGPCWPSTACQRYFTPDAPMPSLPAPLAAYAPQERLKIDARQKLDAIARYASQTEGEVTKSWLSSFARPDELTFPEQYERVGSRWVQLGSRPGDDSTRTLDAEAGCVETNRWGLAGFELDAVTCPASSR